MTDDLDLLAAWRAGDGAAGEALIARHLESVHRFFANKVRHATDDLVQKTFLACIESVDRFAGRSSFRSYLFAIARNVLLRHWRDHHRGIDPVTISAAILIDGADSPADRVAAHEDERRLLQALRSLPLEQQTLLELAYWEGLSDQDLAEVMELPAGTIKSRLRRGRQLLDAALAAAAPSEQALASSRRTLESWAAAIRARTGIAGDDRRR